MVRSRDDVNTVFIIEEENIHNHGQTFNFCDEINPSNSNETLQTLSFCTPFWKQLLGTSIASLAALPIGFVMGYSAILIPQLEKEDSEIKIDTEIASWIASMSALAMAPGGALGGILMDIYGSKKAQQGLAIPLCLGFILIPCTSNIYILYLGRFITGCCVGAIGPLGVAFVGEISQPTYRSFFLQLLTVAVALGTLVVHWMGIYLDWRVISYIFAAYSLGFFVFFSFIPDSHVWFFKLKRTLEAKSSFVWFRGSSEASKLELLAMLQDEKLHTPSSVNSFKMLMSKSVLRPIGIVFLVFTTSQMSGYIAIAFYAVQIIKQTLGDHFDENFVMILLDMVGIVFTLVGCVLLRIMSRRNFTLVGYLLTTVALFGLSLFLFLNQKFPLENLMWIPLCLLILFMAATSAFASPIIWTLMSELIPVKARGLGTGVSSFYGQFLFFIISIITPFMFLELGETSTYAVFGCCVFTGTVILYFTLPETKGKTLDEIEEYFK